MRSPYDDYIARKEAKEREERIAREAEERRAREAAREPMERRLDSETDKLDRACRAAPYSCGSEARDMIDSRKLKRGDKYFPYVPSSESTPTPTPTGSPLGGEPRQPGGIKLDAKPTSSGARVDLSAERERILKLAR